MKQLVSKILFGKDAKFSGLIALAIVASIVLGCNCNKDVEVGNTSKSANSTDSPAKPTETKSEVPSTSETEALVKETISQFSDAVDSGDFSDLHSYASQDFQSSYSVEEMATAFKSYTDKKKIVVPIMEKSGLMTPKFEKEPSIRTEKGLKILMAEGEFATKPFKIRYDFEYVNRDGDWKLLKLIINIP